MISSGSIMRNKAIIFVFALTLGLMLGVGSVKAESGAGALPVGNSCAVTSSVYAAVYSYATGSTYCTASGTLSFPTAGTYDVMIYANMNSLSLDGIFEGETDYWAYGNLGGEVYTGDSEELGYVKFYEIEATSESVMSVGAFASGTWAEIMARQAGSIFYTKGDYFDSMFRLGYYEEGAAGSVYDFLIQKDDFDDTVKIKSMKNTEYVPDPMWVMNQYEQSYAFFSNIAVDRDEQLFGIVDHVERPLTTFPIGYADTRYKLLKIEYYDNDYYYEELPESYELQGKHLYSAQHVATFENQMYVKASRSTDVRFQDLQIIVTVKRAEQPDISFEHTVTGIIPGINDIMADEENDSFLYYDELTYKPKNRRTVQLKMAEGFTATGSWEGVRVYYNTPEYYDFSQLYAYADPAGKATFVPRYYDYGDPEAPDRYFMVSKYKFNEYSHRYVQAGPVISGTAGDELAVVPLKLTEGGAGTAPFSLQDLVKIATSDKTGTWDMDQDGVQGLTKEELTLLTGILNPGTIYDYMSDVYQRPL